MLDGKKLMCWVCDKRFQIFEFDTIDEAENALYIVNYDDIARDETTVPFHTFDYDEALEIWGEANG